MPSLFIRLVILLLVSGFYACHKDPMLWKIDNLNHNEVWVFGHGGMGIFSNHPISSEPSLQKALDMGADGTEMDIQMSKDSVLFTFHHPRLEQSTNCSGIISEKENNEISCNYKNTFRTTDIKVLRLSETLDHLAPSPGQFFVFDCKTPDGASKPYLDAFAHGLLKVIKEHGYENRCFIESTNILFLSILKANDPLAKLFVYTQDFDQSLEIATDLKLFGITIDMRRITKAQVLEAHQKGLHIALFNQQSDKENREAIEMSPDYIQTDKLKHALKIFEKYRR